MIRFMVALARGLGAAAGVGVGCIRPSMIPFLQAGEVEEAEEDMIPKRLQEHDMILLDLETEHHLVRGGGDHPLADAEEEDSAGLAGLAVTSSKPHFGPKLLEGRGGEGDM